MRRLSQDDRRRAVEEAVAGAMAAGAPLPSAVRVAERVAALLVARKVDPGATVLLARAVRRDPTYERAVFDMRARAAIGRARLVDAQTPAWQVASRSARDLASLGASSGAGASGDDTALAGGDEGGAAMDVDDAPRVADAAVAEAAAGGACANDAAAPGGGASGERGAAMDDDTQGEGGIRTPPEPAAFAVAPGATAAPEEGAGGRARHTPRIADAADAEAAAGGARADDAAAPGGGASGEGGAAMDDDTPPAHDAAAITLAGFASLATRFVS